MTFKRITDPSFKYVPSGSTDLRKTFAKVRAEMRKAREAEVAKVTRQVIPIKAQS